MFCFRCGHQLPPKVVACPVCDTPQKRRQRYRQRLFLGLFIFLAGALVGSLVDSFLFKGRAWEHTMLGGLVTRNPAEPGAASSPEALPVHVPVGSSTPTALEPSSGPAPSPGANSQAAPASPPSLALATNPEPPLDARADPLRMVASGLPAPVSPPLVSTFPAAPATPSMTAPEPLSGAVPWPDVKLSFAGAFPLEVVSEVDYHGSLSHDGKVLVFSSNRPVAGKAGFFQCYVKDPVATAPAVRAFPWEGNIWTPEFSPDGRVLVFSSDSQKPEHIFLYDRVTQQPRALTSGPSKNMMPALSPDGKFVAFVSDRRGSNDIWIIGIDGTNLIQITTGKEDDREPRWWPDGRSLVFTRIKEKYRHSVIMRVPLDPQGPPQPLVEGGRNWLADPSPDGRYLAYVRSRDADGSGNVILVRRLDSGAEFAVAPAGAGECYRPIWTRDLTGLIFHSERNGKKNLYQARFSKAPID